MQITRIFHSGFLVETAKRYFIFDYYKGELPKLNPDKPVYVFASHGHQDHYEPKVFELLKQQGIVPGKKYSYCGRCICTQFFKKII